LAAASPGTVLNRLSAPPFPASKIGRIFRYVGSADFKLPDGDHLGLIFDPDPADSDPTEANPTEADPTASSADVFGTNFFGVKMTGGPVLISTPGANVIKRFTAVITLLLA